jgi:hypothetical protein
MTIVPEGSALSTLPHTKSGIVVQQVNRWIGSVFHLIGAQLMKALLRLKSMDEVDRLNDRMLRDIGLTRVNSPAGRFVRWSSLEQWWD